MFRDKPWHPVFLRRASRIHRSTVVDLDRPAVFAFVQSIVIADLLVLRAFHQEVSWPSDALLELNQATVAFKGIFHRPAHAATALKDKGVSVALFMTVVPEKHAHDLPGFGADESASTRFGSVSMFEDETHISIFGKI